MRTTILTAAAALATAAVIACSGEPEAARPTLAPPPIATNQKAPDQTVETLQREILEQIDRRSSPAAPDKTPLTQTVPAETVPAEIAPAVPTKTVPAIPTETVPAQPTEATPAKPTETTQTRLPTRTNPPAGNVDPTRQYHPHASTPKPAPPENAREAAFEILRQLSWTSDGLSEAEKETAISLANLIRTYPDIGMRLVQMPFLETHEPTDAGAAEALWYIATSNPDQTRRILDHPSLSSGITDAQTPLVTLTYGEYLFGADPARLLSDREIESHIHPAELPMAGNILITIVSRTGPEPAAATAARVESDLAWLETYLDQKISTHNVAIHYGATMPPSAKGVNIQTSVMQPASYQSPSQHRWLRHELTHYWFNSNESWLDEGLAQTLTSLLAAGSREPETLPATAPRCPGNVRLADIQRDNPNNKPAPRCLYAVGERIMRTIYQEAGYEEFRKGARRLAARGARPPYQGMGLEHLREAFDHVPDAVAEAEKRWR